MHGSSDEKETEEGSHQGGLGGGMHCGTCPVREGVDRAEAGKGGGKKR